MLDCYIQQRGRSSPNVTLNCLAATLASTETITIDNQPNHTDRYTANTGFSAIDSQNSYNNNAHICPVSSSTNSNNFRWGFQPQKTSSNPITVSVSAFLYYGAFTDEHAKYQIAELYSSETFLQTLGTLNQNTAIIGWNTIGSYTTLFYEPEYQYYMIQFVKLTPGNGLQPSYPRYCGADAVKFTFTY